MQDFRKLNAWKKSHSLTLRTYAETAAFPKGELFGLTSQMRRSAISIPANIAEGCCHGGDPMLVKHLRIALGSAGELEYYAFLAGDLKFLSDTASADLIAASIEAKKLITGLLKAVTRTPLMTKSQAETDSRKLRTDN